MELLPVFSPSCVASSLTARIGSLCCAGRLPAPFYAVPAAQLRPWANEEKMCKLPSAVEKQIL